MGSIPTEVKKIFSLPRVVPCFPLLGLTPSGLFMGLSSTIIYTSELILCSTICVPSATRHNIRMYTLVGGERSHHKYEVYNIHVYAFLVLKALAGGNCVRGITSNGGVFSS